MQRALFAALALILLGAGGGAAQAPVPDDSVLVRATASRQKGADSARITIIELADFQCPYCRDFQRTTMPALDSLYVRTGKVRMVFHNYPLPTHPHAWVAAEAAMCAGAQGRFWPMHDRLYEEQARWGAAEQPAAEFESYAAALGLDMAAFRDCTARDRVAPLIMSDLIQATRGGAEATPTFVVLREPKAGEDPAASQRVLAGLHSVEEFSKAIEELSR